MEKSGIKGIMKQWLVPSAALLIVIVVMLLYYASGAKTKAHKEVEKELIQLTESYASSFGNELSQMETAGVPMGKLASHYSYTDKELIIAMSESLQNESSAYMVIFADASGRGVTQNGTSVNLWQESYYVGEQNPHKGYSYVEKEKITQQEAIVLTIPSFVGDKFTGAIYMYYPVQEFQKAVPSTLLDNDCFFSFIDSKNNIIESYGRNSLFTQGNNINILLENGNETGNSDKFSSNVRKSYSGTLRTEIEKSPTYLFYAPIGVEDFYLGIGVNESYVNRQWEASWQEVNSMVQSLILVIVIFVAVILAVSLGVYINYKKQNKKLEAKAETDSLTGLLNKMATEQKIRQYIKNYPDEKGILCIFDIDNFKSINDTKGHAFGDEVLRAIGFKLQSQFRANDILGRTGGDEFMIFVKHLNDDLLIQKEAEKIRKLFHGFKVGEYSKSSVTLSIGAAIFIQDGKDFEGLYKAADSALYKAKRHGKNQLAFYKELNQEEIKVREIEREEEISKNKDSF